MPGLYLLCLLVSIGGIAVLDARFRLALWAAPVTTLLATVCGTVFLLAWDAAGIAAGVFVRGESPLLIGIDLAPHLPLEEPVFLAFLSYLALVVHAASLRLRTRSGGPAAPGEPSGPAASTASKGGDAS
ncbi:MAG: lycopene cyclase domain-containing protein [Microbacterium sp.]|uniref:lycopene cyclase domain-containing protein n=1 Tax=Microbacterium sp. TaxID=51671 RepID=UPI001ACF6EAC|nr:lycopene cyclase domain-containing protein [Microbacterium sp.]MBN9176015.1 lycopene cyclase domain-containing protein [Microbacterium sp.]